MSGAQLGGNIASTESFLDRVNTLLPAGRRGEYKSARWTCDAKIAEARAAALKRLKIEQKGPPPATLSVGAKLQRLLNSTSPLAEKQRWERHLEQQAQKKRRMKMQRSYHRSAPTLALTKVETDLAKGPNEQPGGNTTMSQDLRPGSHRRRAIQHSAPAASFIATQHAHRRAPGSDGPLRSREKVEGVTYTSCNVLKGTSASATPPPPPPHVTRMKNKMSGSSIASPHCSPTASIQQAASRATMAGTTKAESREEDDPGGAFE